MSASHLVQAAWRKSAAELTDSMEAYLTTGVFGDSANISGTVAAYYRGAAWACEKSCGLAPGSLSEETVPQLESLRRFAVDEALHHLMAEELDQAREVLGRHLTLRARAVSDSLVMDDVSSSGSEREPTFPHAGKDHWLGRLFLERFSDAIVIDGEGVEMKPCQVTDDIAAAHSRAIALARRSVPRLAGELFDSVSHVVLYRAAKPCSGYTVSAPLFVFVAEQTFERDELAAELLIHECLHQKLNDISAVRSLLRPDYNDAESATITVPWSFGSDRTRYFSADRSFAAFHVYTHQALLYLGMLATSKSGEDSALVADNLILSWARAAHFERELGAGSIRDEWGPDGYRLAEWLSYAVCELGKFTLPDGTVLSSHADAFSSPKTAA
ncbi:HEXXH motif-containing putative peptide modification protein [Streptomyces nojiriensis]|uniref:aKG-HExxH-type peptide beta-hydroxylase n=1 Tax=Streptomyces nojiriensis TaxID=66374 RepID=UPI0035E19E76